MAENIIHGEFEYNEKTYPFVIQNRILTVVQSAFHYLVDFRGKEDLGTLMGVTDLAQPFEAVPSVRFIEFHGKRNK